MLFVCVYHDLSHGYVRGLAPIASLLDHKPDLLGGEEITKEKHIIITALAVLIFERESNLLSLSSHKPYSFWEEEKTHYEHL